ncbi:MAG: D-alanyl-D-alanine carboxypeptidase family protein, partial [Pseudomonadota bacterium]
MFPVINRFVPMAVLAFAVMAAMPAHAAPEASLVMDMRNGKVLYARSADRKLHPASLTKMMTLYLTFEALRAGTIRLDQKVRVSRHAARQPASKLYLKAGQRVTIRSMIRATAIKSANDAAMVLAEAVGGSQRNFAKMMTRRAKRLGMTNTRFLNPHGLTKRGQYSTARDMAKLGRHLFHDFPKYYNIFKRRTDVAAGKKIWSTNRLLSTYRGADGIKTGYTRAAGYNLVASAHRGKKRVIAVLFGGRSSGDRARKVARLLDIGFSRSKTNVRRVKPQQVQDRTRVASAKGRLRKPVKRSPLPPLRPGLDAGVAAALAEVLSSRAEASTRVAHVIKRKTRSKIIAAGTFAPKVAERPKARPDTVLSVDQAVAKVLEAAPKGLPTDGALARVPLPQ